MTKAPRSTFLAPSPCPSCGKKLDAATRTKGTRGPQPGNITVCLYCGHIMAFADDLSFRDLTDAEMIRVAGDPDILRIQRARDIMAKQDQSRSRAKGDRKG